MTRFIMVSIVVVCFLANWLDSALVVGANRTS